MPLYSTFSHIYKIPQITYTHKQDMFTFPNNVCTERAQEQKTLVCNQFYL